MHYELLTKIDALIESCQRIKYENPSGKYLLTLDSTTRHPPVDNSEVCCIVSECLGSRPSALTDAEAVSEDIYSVSDQEIGQTT